MADLWQDHPIPPLQFFNTRLPKRQICDNITLFPLCSSSTLTCLCGRSVAGSPHSLPPALQHSPAQVADLWQDHPIPPLQFFNTRLPERQICDNITLFPLSSSSTLTCLCGRSVAGSHYSPPPVLQHSPACVTDLWLDHPILSLQFFNIRLLKSEIFHKISFHPAYGNSALTCLSKKNYNRIGLDPAFKGILKGLSGEIYGGSKMKSIVRFPCK